MKKIILSFLSFSYTFLLISCEENFSPKAPASDGYVLNCIVKLTSTQLGYLSDFEVKVNRVYDVDGFYPQPPDSSTFVNGARIVFYKNTIAHPLSDTVTMMINDQPKRVPINKYIPKYYPSLFGNEKCRIIAELPNGKILSADMQIPREKSFEFNRVFNHGITGETNFLMYGKSLVISWGDPYNSGHIMFPRFQIVYTIDSVYYKKEIPLTYINRNGKYQAMLPGAVYVPQVSFDYAAIDSAMSSIGKGMTNKRKVVIINCVFSVTEYDRNLSSYYTSTNGFMDSFSIRLDENIYSNINGGYGIFGAAMTTTKSYLFDRFYVHSFDYSMEFEGS